jgi:hypothetical protein
MSNLSWAKVVRGCWTVQEPTVGLLSPGFRSGPAEPRVPRRG